MSTHGNEPARKAGVLIAVEGDLLRRALVELIERMPEASVASIVRDPLDVIDALGSSRYDVIVLDVVLAERVAARRPILGEHPRVLLISPRRHLGLDPACGLDCACGFVRERAPLAHLRVVLRTIACCPVRHVGTHERCRVCPLPASLLPAALPLSARELDVFARRGLGFANAVIAEELGLSVKTVEAHGENIKRKLGLDSSAALNMTAAAWRRGDYAFDEGAG